MYCHHYGTYRDHCSSLKKTLWIWVKSSPQKKRFAPEKNQMTFLHVCMAYFSVFFREIIGFKDICFASSLPPDTYWQGRRVAVRRRSCVYRVHSTVFTVSALRQKLNNAKCFPGALIICTLVLPSSECTNNSCHLANKRVKIKRIGYDRTNEESFLLFHPGNIHRVWSICCGATKDNRNLRHVSGILLRTLR